MDTLRVGICRCTPLYHGQLGGKRLKLQCWDKVYVFDLAEVKVRDENPDVRAHDLKAALCTFFVDVHFNPNRMYRNITYHTRVDLNLLWPRDRLTYTEYTYEQGCEHQHLYGARPASTKKILIAMKEVIERKPYFFWFYERILSQGIEYVVL